MGTLDILNSKDKKTFLKDLEDQFGIDDLPGKVFLINNKDKIYMSVRELDLLPFDSFTIDRIGLYIGKYYADGFRPSVDGSQVLGPLAKKNVLTVDKEKKHEWMKGYRIDVDVPDGFYLIKNIDDFLGSAKVKNKEALNAVPKGRRLQVVNEKVND